ncbi:hypothetical protein MSP8886_01472 [Marinomonas spartinae]|uniref:Uncharacterized protein n=1 Tax=Marinomonas spartinae TaxID=1792290 RepID=A0A1A8TC49_9GAMM|nr:hypothetical protein [Marinomonas spartinae]SBS29198.1 hypothetical protein MSP8886_01472 [Marinomonas spartinae]
MELIQVDDVRAQIAELKKLVRVVDPGTHPTLTNNGVREIDFKFSSDMEYVEASSDVGLSFATNMKKFKKLVQSKARFHAEMDIYTIDESMLQVDGLKIVHDRPGHASLTVTKRIRVPELIQKLEIVARKLEKIGRMRVSS